MSVNIEATSDDYTCHINISAYVHEISETGEELPLNFANNPDLNPNEWGFADTLHLPPNQPTIISFNHAENAQYNLFAHELSFVPFPLENEIYRTNSEVSTTLLYDRNLYEIERKEIKRCNSTQNDTWQCLDTNTTGNLETISGLIVKCNINLEFGWVVQRKQGDPLEQSFTKVKPLGSNPGDINLDQATNLIDLLEVLEAYSACGKDLKADLNNDGCVNSIDYTIVTDNITL